MGTKALSADGPTYASCLARASRVASMSRPLVEGSGSPSSAAEVRLSWALSQMRVQPIRTCGELCKKRLQFWRNALASKDIRWYCWRCGLLLLCTLERVECGGWLG